MSGADRKISQGVLASDLATRLDAALADPCLPFEPAVTPPRLPRISGVDDRSCLDGANFTLEIARGDQVRTIEQLCATRFSAGAAIRVLEDAR